MGIRQVKTKLYVAVYLVVQCCFAACDHLKVRGCNLDRYCYVVFKLLSLYGFQSTERS